MPTGWEGKWCWKGEGRCFDEVGKIVDGMKKIYCSGWLMVSFLLDEISWFFPRCFLSFLFRD